MWAFDPEQSRRVSNGLDGSIVDTGNADGRRAVDTEASPVDGGPCHCRDGFAVSAVAFGLQFLETISYSKFEELTGQGAVTDVIVGKDTIEGNRHWRTVQSLPQVRLDKWSRGLERGQRRSSG
jgi:hypothetical protein